MKNRFKLNTLNKVLLLLLVMALLHFMCRKLYLIEGNTPTCITSSELNKTRMELNELVALLERDYKTKISDLNINLENISSRCNEANKKCGELAKHCLKKQ
tara:strand:+ start:219 stop:521 length:303 start_codon:yes stop_codon:yes gene_type:complete